MTKIEFNELHKSVIAKFLKGMYDPFFATEEEQNAFNEVIDIAETRLDEYSEDYDFGDDLIKWVWAEYQTQEANA